MNQLEKNITDAIKTAKRDGMTAISIANLKQVTSTRGLKISVAEYHNTFDEVAKQVAKRLRFPIIKGGEA
jgi:hypothetical protein